MVWASRSTGSSSATALLTVGAQAFFLGCIARVLFDYTGRQKRRWLRVFPYTRTVLLSVALVLLGIGCAIPLVATYIGNGLALEQSDALPNHLAVTGVALAILGAQLFVFTLLLHGTVVATTRGRPSMPRNS